MENLFNRLTDLVVKYDNVILMSHCNPDLDALGSCLGFSSLLTNLEIENYIFLDTNKYDNISIKQSLALVPNYNYINEKNYKEVITDNSLLIILDVHQQARVEYAPLVDEIEDVIILDHHIKSNDYIKETQVFYIDSSLSSVVELISGYSKHLNIPINPVVATIMLAGMEIDTNGFNIKITERAFEAAAYLVSIGADPIVKQNIMKEPKDNFLKKADYIKSSYIYKNKYAICLLDGKAKTEDLAEISQALLSFDDVEAGFTIGILENNNVGLSARSLGDIDVCEIVTKLGGGGHATASAVQLPNTTVKALEKLLKKELGD